MKLSFRKDLQIASVRSEANWNKFRIHTLLQNSKRKQPSVNSYICTKFNNSRDSITQIASEVVNSSIPFKERIEGMVLNKSSAHISTCIEYIPRYTIMKTYYLFPNLDILDLDFKYLISKDNDFVKIPKDICNDNDTRKEYERILLKQFNDYRELRKVTRDFFKDIFSVNQKNMKEVKVWKRRSAEVLEYLLPLGLSSRYSVQSSAKDTHDFIKKLGSNDSIVENELYSMFLELLSEQGNNVDGYIKEVDVLLGDTDLDCSIKNSTQSILKYLSEDLSTNQLKVLPINELDRLIVEYLNDPTEELISHYESLLNPLGSLKELQFSDEMQKHLGEILFEEYGDVKSIGNIADMGTIKISGMSSIFLINRFNNVSRLKKFIPLFDDNISMDQELSRKNNQCFFLPRYLYMKEAKSLRRKYEKRLLDTYSRIKKWRKNAVKYLSKEVIDEYTKYLLPNAHASTFFFYASVDDLQYTINIKSTNDVSMDERMFVYEWLRLLSVKDMLWKPLLRRNIKPDICNRDQFFNIE